MTQAQAIELGYTHFIEVYRNREWEEGNTTSEEPIEIEEFDYHFQVARLFPMLYTVAIFLIKPKQ